MSDSERSANGSDTVEIELNVVAPEQPDAEGTRTAITEAITNKLKQLPTDIFTTLKPHSSIAVKASVRPKGKHSG